MNLLPPRDRRSLRCYFRRGLDTGRVDPHTLLKAPPWPNVSADTAGMIDMRRLNSLLRSTRWRIGCRLAEIVAIAAASLPAAGV